jgi:hypothetical protein
LPDELAGGEPLLPRVGGHDVREVRPGGLEVVVVAVGTGGGEATGLVVVEDAGADRHVEARLAADEGHDLLEMPHQPLVGAAHGVDQAEFARSQCRRLRGRGQHSSCPSSGTAFTGES